MAPASIVVNSYRVAISHNKNARDASAHISLPMKLSSLARPTRKGISDGLLILAMIGGVISVILAFIVFIAGTTIIPGSGDNPDHLFWKPLALVTFDGLVPNNDTSKFLVQLNWYASSFGWEYPNAPKNLPKAGITSSGLRWSSNIVNDLHQIARDLNLPQDTWDCPKFGAYEDPCGNIFFEAWRSYMVHNGMPISSWLLWVMVTSALVLGSWTMVQEWMIQKRPHWMRCRCIIGKRWCPCPKGTKEEIENHDDFVWDKVRLSYWTLSAAYFGTAAAHACVTSVFFVKFLGFLEERLPEGISMRPRRRIASEVLLWVAFGIRCFSALCMAIRWKLSRRPKGWLDEQSVGLDGNSGRPGDARYTD
ncbi:hypothetical protein B0J15DRAFT_588798 [Fusarium solani]|uniref:Uncharacterized protein n=1 Tax=Fusarium solani TaxID=169388 RepID=A0A9P9L3W4_FUSSL|nr:uncharacterized protein B0J15DRAFT_588798 [Fusarium solani]KAH7273470.1 hypothetical protein B0J15DRAFT_588798 [Fusarium solani]